MNVNNNPLGLCFDNGEIMDDAEIEQELQQNMNENQNMHGQIGQQHVQIGAEGQNQEAIIEAARRVQDINLNNNNNGDQQQQNQQVIPVQNQNGAQNILGVIDLNQQHLIDNNQLCQKVRNDIRQNQAALPVAPGPIADNRANQQNADLYIRPRQRGYRGGDPLKKAFYRKKYNPYERGLENLATFQAKQVIAMTKEIARENEAKRREKYRYRNNRRTEEYEGVEDDE